jgi:glycosyltransferase involved in cell wall biosynthesis
MKLIMINDCASVGETLLKYMPKTVEKERVERTRGLWSKTFGIALKILKTKGDLYHVNYLLQDCYIASRLGKRPLVGYSVGSDLRLYLNDWRWGRIVQHNVKKCDKVMVSTPDLISIAKEFRDDVEYLPPPVDSELFYPKPLVSHDGKKKVLISSSSSWEKGKGTHIAVRGLAKLKDEIDVSIIAHGPDFSQTLELASSLGLHMNVLPKVPHEHINEYYWNSDLIVDQFLCECPGMTSLEAIACGRPAITNVSSHLPELAEFPLKDVNSEEKIAAAVRTTYANERILIEEQNYVAKYHKPEAVVTKLMNIYDSVLKG